MPLHCVAFLAERVSFGIGSVLRGEEGHWLDFPGPGADLDCRDPQPWLSAEDLGAPRYVVSLPTT